MGNALSGIGSQFTSGTFRPSSGWVLPLALAFLVLAGGAAAFREVGRLGTRLVDSKLTAILDASVKGLTMWVDEQQRIASFLAQEPAVAAAVSELVQLGERGATGGELVEAASQSGLAELLAEAASGFEYVDYAVVDLKARVLLDGFPGLVGTDASPLWNEYLPKIVSGEPVVARPHRPTLSEDATELERPPMMFVAAPVHGEAGEVVAALAFGIAPQKQFTQMLSVARSGKTGETFAYDAAGWMISESRFDDELRSSGVLQDAPCSTAVLNVRVADRVLLPGRRDAEASTPDASQGAGVAAHTLMSGRNDKDALARNLQGYEDYRGELVVGVGRWIPELSFGVVTKMDYAEAYAPGLLLRNLLAALFGLGVVAAGGNLLYARVMGKLRARVRRAEREIKRLGQYTLEEKIGQGGMGVIYRASHALLRRPTAVKLLPQDRSSAAAIANFEKEVQLTSQLTHPNTIAIYDFGHTPDNVFYYAMEFLEGLDLARIVKADGPLPAGRAIAILRQVCGSLQEAHSAGLIHRDIKPANVMLCKRGGRYDFAKLLDFGLVKDATDAHLADGPDGLAGTPLYMSPEAIEHPAAIDSRSDIYSIGALAYYLVTGTPVFQGSNVAAICVQQLSEPPEPLSARAGAAVDEDLATIVLQCLEKDPAQRPQTVAKLEAMLANCVAAGSWTQEDAKTWWETRNLSHALTCGALTEPLRNKPKLASQPGDAASDRSAKSLD
ncbi:Serine/threonine-protein kinase PknB [Posidoniimonas polymericola]|uniref:Serine/threonine-protein kinase PknB n=1 Tax=Posidoniimonas polymericola TaxID=2528002 RepID=A0A5C5YTP9_9BACT|nr:serine/threonine protein kinase [Posidoniimonas polymericola]TWT78355.1 Serine/threonine-protein kinase PknB [Posidoniimonas polymericola]